MSIITMSCLIVYSYCDFGCPTRWWSTPATRMTPTSLKVHLVSASLNFSLPLCWLILLAGPSALTMLASKKSFEKKSNEPTNTTRALLRAWRPATNSVLLPTACGYLNSIYNIISIIATLLFIDFYPPIVLSFVILSIGLKTKMIWMTIKVTKKPPKFSDFSLLSLL